MLRRTRFISWPLVVILLLMPLLINLTFAADAAARVKSVTGVAYLTTVDGGTAVKIEAGIRLSAGDEIKTTRNTEVVLELANGSIVKVGSSTQVTVGSLSPRRADFSVEYGYILSIIARAADESYNYRVSTPAANAAVRGTVFLTEVAEDGTTEIQVLKGEVATTSPTSVEEILVGEGLKTTVLPGGLPAIPIALTAAEITAITSLAGAFLQIGSTGIAAGAGGAIAAGGAAGVGTAVGSTWWIWVLVGVGVAGGAAAGVVFLGDDPPPQGGDDPLVDPPDHPDH
jgi:hypothetical protein